MILKTHF